jgi:protein TonB
VALVYAALLVGAVLASNKVAQAPKRKLPKSLTVTLYDAPKSVAPKLLDDTGGSTAGAAGEAEVFTPAVKTGKHRTAPPTPPKAVAQTEAKPLNIDKSLLSTATSDDPKPAAPVLTPAPVGETSAPSPALATTAHGPSTAPGMPGGSGTGAPGGMGGSGTGTSTGTGSGWKIGTASGDTTVLPFGDGMTRPSQVGQIDIQYTREARDAEVQGMVITECTITTSGSLQNCKVLKGLPLMDQQVLAALSRTKYTPVIYQGKPTAVRYKIPIRLVLPP